MNTALLSLIQRESRSPGGFSFVPIAELWADIEIIRSWAKCDDFPLVWSEFRAQVDELAGRGLVEFENERVRPVAGAEVVPAGMMF